MVTIQELTAAISSTKANKVNITLYLKRENLERMKAIYGRKLSQAIDKLIEEHLGQVEKEKAP